MTLKFTAHAIRRMRKWAISDDDVLRVLTGGEVVEAYPTDTPFPSRLMLGWIKGRPVHVVVADNAQTGETVVITVYEPDPQLWDPTFRVRRQPA